MAIIKNPLVVMNNSDYDNLKGIVDGSITSFKMPSGMTKIEDYRFQGFTSLVSANLTGCLSLGSSTFYNCVNLTNVVFDNNITTIPTYCFSGCNNLVINKLPESITGINAYGFQGVQIREIDNSFDRLNSYAIQTTALTKLHVKLTGVLYDNTCIEAYYVNDFDCSKSYNTSITFVPNAFAGVGSKRDNPSSNVLTFDFRGLVNATTMSGYCLSWGSNSSYATYSKYFFPSKLATVPASSLSYSNNCEFYFTSPTPPTLSGTNAFNQSSSYKIFVPYDKINTYKNATNWTTQASYIYGFAEENTFNNGDTLPTINNEGYQLTWYSDPTLTQQITTVADKTQILYCVSGANVVAYFVRQEMLRGCSITISDGTNTYGLGDYIMANTTVTITGVPTTAGDVPYLFEVNGNNFTSGDTFTVTADIRIKALYWDGNTLPYDSVLANNTWEEIKQASQFGIANQLWSVGDTKTLTGGDGNTYTFRIVDLQTGRYKYNTTGDPTHITFEQVNISALSTYRIATSSSQIYSQCYMYKTDLPNYKTNVLGNIAPLLEEILIKCKTNYNYSGTGVADVVADLFLPAVAEMFPSNTASGYIQERISTYTNNDMAGFDYYVAHDTDNDRNKTNQPYFLRSPYNSSNWRNISYYGTLSTISYSYSSYIAPCFAW